MEQLKKMVKGTPIVSVQSALAIFLLMASYFLYEQTDIYKEEPAVDSSRELLDVARRLKHVVGDIQDLRNRAEMDIAGDSSDADRRKHLFKDLLMNQQIEKLETRLNEIIEAKRD